MLFPLAKYPMHKHSGGIYSPWVSERKREESRNGGRGGEGEKDEAQGCLKPPCKLQSRIGRSVCKEGVPVQLQLQ